MPVVVQELLNPSGIFDALFDDHIDRFRESKEAARLVVENDEVKNQASIRRLQDSRLALEAARKAGRGQSTGMLVCPRSIRQQ